MKFNKAYLFYILGLIGLFGTLVVYLYVYKDYNAQTEQLAQETSSLRAEIKDLEEKTSKIEDYETEMKKMNQEMSTLYVRFAPYFQMEDMMKIIYDMNSYTNYDSVDFMSEVSFESSTPVLEYTTGSTSTLPQYGLYNDQYNLSFKTTYTGMKEIIHYLQNHKKLKTITEISFSFDETTGLLQGNVSFNQHFLTGTGEKYQDPVFPPVESGIDSIFGGTEKEVPAMDYDDYYERYYIPSLESPVE